jgi:hypothetical protein
MSWLAGDVLEEMERQQNDWREWTQDLGSICVMNTHWWMHKIEISNDLNMPLVWGSLFSETGSMVILDIDQAASKPAIWKLDE